MAIRESTCEAKLFNPNGGMRICGKPIKYLKSGAKPGVKYEGWYHVNLKLTWYHHAVKL